MHHEKGRLDLVHLEEGRVVDVSHRLLPEAPPYSALGVLVLELTVHAAVPPDAAVGAGHVGDRGTGFHGREEVGPGDHVGQLVPTPGVPLGSDSVFIYVPLVQDFQDTRHHGVDGALPRMSDFVRDVWNEEDVTPAHVEAVIDRGASGVGSHVPVQAIGTPLIEVHHQGVLLVRIEAFGLDENPLKGGPVIGDPFDDLCCAPGVLLLLRVGVRDLLHVAEIRIREPEVWKLFESRLGDHVYVGVVGLRGIPEPDVVHHQLLGLLVSVEPVPIEAALLGVKMERRQKGVLTGVDELGSAAAATSASTPPTPGGEVHVAELDVVGPPHAFGDIPGRLPVRGIHLPDVEAVPDQEGIVVFEPADGAVASWGIRVVVDLVVNGVGNGLGDVPDLPRGHVHGHVVFLEAVPPGEVFTARGEGG